MQFRTWAQENIKTIRLVTAWLLFIATFAFSFYVKDFNFSDNDPALIIVLVVMLRMVILVALSVFNIYGISPFIKMIGKDKVARQFGAAVIGFFGLGLCLPLAAIMFGMGLAVSLLAFLTGIHIIVRAKNFKE
jgi:hypothetical protein